MTVAMIIDKLRKILLSRSIADISTLFDGAKVANIVQFKNKIKPLGMLGREIDRMYEAIMARDGTGHVDLGLLSRKMQRLQAERGELEAHNSKRIAHLRHLLVKRMNTIEDAFHLVRLFNLMILCSSTPMARAN